jgi:predicted negative regulator of RcsB-dependent stress response
MFKFTIRDLLWLTLVVALAIGWWVEHRYWEQRRLQSIADPYHSIMLDVQPGLSGD